MPKSSVRLSSVAYTSDRIEFLLLSPSSHGNFDKPNESSLVVRLDDTLVSSLELLHAEQFDGGLFFEHSALSARKIEIK